MHEESGNIAESHKTIELDIEGMDCPACAAKIERRVSKLNGIGSIRVNLGSETATIEYLDNELKLDSIKNEIDKLGYKAIEPESDDAEEQAESEKRSALNRLKRKIIVSATLSTAVVLLGMKQHISFLASVEENVANIISLVLSTVIVFWCGSKFLRGFWIALKNFSADMDTLIAIGTLSAYLYSVYVMLFPHSGGMHHTEVYFESASMIITFILAGTYLEAKMKNRTQYAIKSLMSLQSKEALVERNGEEMNIPARKLREGDLVIVKPGERIPVDGIVKEGSSAVDESMVTGESIPDEKTPGKKVIGGTLNSNGYLKIVAEKVGKDSFLSKVINLVKEAQKSKPQIQRIADKVSAVFVPIVILIAIITFAVWIYLIGETFSFSLLKAVAVLIIACPCALGLATPIAVVLGVGKAAENKILFNNAEAIENVNKIDTIVFDKTGTLTTGNLIVDEVKSYNGYSSDEISRIAASVERYSEHPVARAITEHFKINSGSSTSYYNTDNFRITSGIGVEAEMNGKSYRIGGANLVDKFRLQVKSEENIPDANTELKNIFLFENEQLIGEIKISDKLKPESFEVIRALKQNGFRISMISGDSKQEAERVALATGIDDFSFKVLPDGKQDIIQRMQSEGRIVAMVGDGINDAPSLSKADLGIAIGTGQDIAIQSADVILVKGDLRNLFALVKISNKTIRIIKQNIFWAFFYNAAAIPLAAGVLIPWGIAISPVMASMFMALSDVITVIGNSLRLKYMKIK